ncbi:MAG TPA: response regulator [Actinomycetota bacterium]|jgi:DNA-binding response OmpR family regulator|nr:response regulator [Actinomycetota bacterium]
MARVLVIDDEPDVLLLCRVNLEHAGHEVLEALDAERGLELAFSQNPDVIVLDLMLPLRDGFDVLRELDAADQLKSVPVLVLSARARWEDRVRGWQAGASEYLTKPFSPIALTEVLERVNAMSPVDRQEHRAEALRTLLHERV